MINPTLNHTLIHHKAALDGQAALPNTLEAIENCLCASAPVIEIDICALAGDDYLVLHNDTLDDETTGRGSVRHCTVETARQLKLAPHGAISPYRPPLLSEVVQLWQATPHPDGTHLQLDFKDAIPFDSDEPLQRLAQLIAPLGKQVIVSSVADWQLRRLHKLAPDIRLGFDPQLYLDWRGKEDELFPRSLGAYGYWDDAPLAMARLWPTPQYLADRCAALVQMVPSAEIHYFRYGLVLQSLNEGFNWASALAEHGVALDVWTVDIPKATAAAQTLIAANVPYITTNTPKAMQKMKDAM